MNDNTKSIEVSIGIPAYNEEQNIIKLLNALLKQKLNKVRIKEIIVVSDGSTDSTVKKVKAFIKNNKKAGALVKVISYKNRKGKWFAINKFLESTKSEYLILSSADIIPANQKTIENLSLPLLNRRIGIVASHPIPTNNFNTYLGFSVNLIWKLHDNISMVSPKFGEMIAFKKVLNRIHPTAADEEYIAHQVKSRGLRGYYARKAVIYNHGPETLKEYLTQRRRIYCAHLELKKSFGYQTPTLSNLKLLKFVLKEINIKDLNKIFFAVSIEAISRMLGYYDFLRGRKHYVWKRISTSKRVLVKVEDNQNP